MTNGLKFECPICEFKSSTSDALRIHASKAHCVSSIQLYNLLHPNNNTCSCGEPLKFLSLNLGYKTPCKKCAEKEWRAKAASTRRAKNKKAWNNGLTKDNDIRIALSAEKISKTKLANPTVSWSKGLTKNIDLRLMKISQKLKKKYDDGELTALFKGETKDNNVKLVERGEKISKSLAIYNPHTDPERKSEISAKISKTRIERIAARDIIPTRGVVPWCKGLTKETDDRIAEISRKVSLAKTGTPGWSRGLTRELDERLAHIGDALRGKPGWLEGKTKENEPRLKVIADKRRLSHEEVMKRLAEHNKFEIIGDVVHNSTTSHTSVRLRCKSCSVERVTLLRSCFYPHKPRCQNCDSQHGSKWQQEIAEYVRTLGFVDTVCNDTKTLPNNFELDVFVPSKKFAIECNGLYWHSQAAGKHRAYHELKKKSAHDVNITLIQLFEDEWELRKPQVMSLIAHKLGCFVKKVGARSCTIVENNELARLKLKEWHLEGVGRHSEIGLLLRDKNGTDIAAMTLGKPLHKKSDYYELQRFACEPGTIIVGGLSKLVKYAINKLQCSHLMTYVDTRLGNGNGYIYAGFRLTKTTGLRFWWTDFKKRFNRFKFKATTEKSENEVAKEAGVYKIYACANNVFELKKI